MNPISASNLPEASCLGVQLQSVSRRHALASVGVALVAVPFATPALVEMPVRRDKEKASRHAQNKRVVTEFLDRMASSDQMAALRQYCHTDCRFEVFHPFNSLVGVEAAEAAFWGR